MVGSCFCVQPLSVCHQVGYLRRSYLMCLFIWLILNLRLDTRSLPPSTRLWTPVPAWRVADGGKDPADPACPPAQQAACTRPGVGASLCVCRSCPGATGCSHCAPPRPLAAVLEAWCTHGAPAAPLGPSASASARRSAAPVPQQGLAADGFLGAPSGWRFLHLTLLRGQRPSVSRMVCLCSPRGLWLWLCT